MNPKKTEIILHRGYKGKYLENSKASFENALKEGMSFETDIRVSKDKKCFMIHDESLDRLLNAYGKVVEYNAEDLRKMRYKEDNSSLVSFEELLNLARNNQSSGKIFIHIKHLDDVHRAFNDLNCDLAEKLRFFACDDITLTLIDLIRKNYPSYEVGLHVTEDFLYKDEEHFGGADFIWADEITKKSITPELVSIAHKLGKPVYAISSELIPESIFNKDIEDRWRELVEAGVDGICTDKPLELAEFLKKGY